MAPKRKSNYSSDSPGPGAYNPQILSRSFKFSMGQKIFPELRDKIPGPGAYSPELSYEKIFSK
jgi:Sperm-tail PG-rich repeat